MQLLVSFQWLIERNMILFASLLEWLKYVLFQDSRKALEYFFEVSAYSVILMPIGYPLIL